MAARAVENLSPMVAVNILGEDGNGVRYAGDSLVCAADGAILLDALDRTGVFTQTLQLEDVREWRRSFPAWQDADAFELEE